MDGPKMGGGVLGFPGRYSALKQSKRASGAQAKPSKIWALILEKEISDGPDFVRDPPNFWGRTTNCWATVSDNEKPMEN